MTAGQLITKSALPRWRNHSWQPGVPWPIAAYHQTLNRNIGDGDIAARLLPGQKTPVQIHSLDIEVSFAPKIARVL